MIYQSTQGRQKMKTLSEKQIEKVLKQVEGNKRDNLLIRMSLEAGLKPVHLAEMKISEVLTPSGEVKSDVTTGSRTTYLNPQLRTLTQELIEARFRVSCSRISSLDVYLFGNREPRGHFTAQSMATHLTSVIRKSGVDASASSLRNTFIFRQMRSGNLEALVRSAAVNPLTAARYIFREYEVIPDREIAI